LSRRHRGSGDALQFILATAPARLRHGLPLQRIHTRQSTNTGLIQFDHPRRVFAGLPLRVQFPLDVQQPLPELCAL
jgi:hypothetical protein